MIALDLAAVEVKARLQFLDPVPALSAAAHQDLHRLRAAQMFGVPYDEVTPAQRLAGKRLNYMDVYTLQSAP